MHSRKMRTARLLTVSQHALFAGAGGVNLWPGEYLPTGVYLPGGGGGVYLPGGGRYLPRYSPPPPVNRMTDRCKNITLPQTSFAGGNYTNTKILPILCSYPDSWYEDITSNAKFYSLAATISSKIIGIIVSEIKPRTRCNREVQSYFFNFIFKTNCT